MASNLETGNQAHQDGVDRLLASYRAIPEGAPVRLAKKTSNLFRKRSETSAPGLDVSGLAGVISVDPIARTADVAGMCTYEDLVEVTLRYGLAPLVVPQLKTITLGGAVTGLGIESSSFRNGLPHESVIEMDILTPSGEIVTASPEQNTDLFRAFPNSYGTLGYSVRLKIELETVPPYVALRHVRFHTITDLIATLGEVVTSRTYAGEQVDYVDGVVFTETESYLTLGRQTDEPGPTSDYTDMNIFYRSIQHEDGISTDRLSIAGYLWRWDTDWFWCSRAFGAQNPTIRRLWPKRLRRSSVYWKLIGLDQKYDIGDRIERRKGNPPRERVVQDIEVPIENTVEFLRWFLAEVPIEPLWLCPLMLHDESAGDQPWSLYPLRTGHTYVNVGFWSSVPQGPEPGYTNRQIESKVTELNGHKSLYSEAFYSEDEFAALYGGDIYSGVKKQYDPDNRLLNLYAKAVQRR